MSFSYLPKLVCKRQYTTCIDRQQKGGHVCMYVMLRVSPRSTLLRCVEVVVIDSEGS